jgi:hypothetical protein
VAAPKPDQRDGSRHPAARVVLSLGGVEAQLQDYERLVQELGWSVGRLLPWSFAVAAALPEPDADGDNPSRDLLLCDADGALGALFQSGGVPRFHRSWRNAVAGDAVAEELPALRRYVNDHLESTVGALWLCGDAAWTGAASAACQAASMPARVVAPEAALQAAIEG